MRNVTDRNLRRARLLAARSRPIGGINRRGILCGDGDLGSVVQAWKTDESTAPSPEETAQ